MAFHPYGTEGGSEAGDGGGADGRHPHQARAPRHQEGGRHQGSGFRGSKSCPLLLRESPG